MSPQKHHVLIIGGGLAGLALSQALRKHSIESTVFERDANADGRKQSWAVSLDGCVPDLVTMLPEDLGPLTNISNNQRLGIRDSASVVDPATGQRVLHFGDKSKLGEPGYLINANRACMRNFLAQNANLQWNKKFERYEEDDTGVTAYFSDGTTARGTVLIGVDGTGSLVRSQLLSGMAHTKLHTLPYGVIGAEYDLTASELAEFQRDSTALQVSIQDGILSYIGLREPITSSNAIIYYHIYWIDEKAAEQDTAYWTQSATQEEMHAKVMELTKGWKGTGKATIDRSTVADIMMPPYMLRQFSPPHSLPEGRVTIMGDAAHSMTPFRGIGANTALQDAMDLAKLFAQHADAFRTGGNVEVKAILKEYEKVMIPRGQEMVQTSGVVLSSDPKGDDTVKGLQKRYSEF